MNKSRATSYYHNHLHHQHALLQLLQLQQYRELCYQMYLVGLALNDVLADRQLEQYLVQKELEKWVYFCEGDGLISTDEFFIPMGKLIRTSVKGVFRLVKVGSSIIKGAYIYIKIPKILIPIENSTSSQELNIV